MLALERSRSPLYDQLVQEDRIVEWWTAFLFLAAGVVFARAAWRGRRAGDAAVGLFCLAAAGEEISWGQRILGFTPPATFLEHNIQQEANLHNLAEAFGQPKWTFIAVLVVYGVLLPAAARVSRLRGLIDRSGLTAPPPAIALWFLTATLLLVWYPVRLTGEWVEALGGALFLAVAAPSVRAFVAGAVATLALAGVADRAGAWVPADPRRTACALEETAALLSDVRSDTLSPVTVGTGRMHRRLATLWRQGDLDPAASHRFRQAPCSLADGLAVRRRHGIDPWGTAYWLRRWTDSSGTHVVVYSFGQNRRRDAIGDAGASGDDVAASATTR
jgi:hypothetical protein